MQRISYKKILKNEGFDILETENSINNVCNLRKQRLFALKMIIILLQKNLLMTEKHFIHNSSIVDEKSNYREEYKKIWHFCHISEGVKIGKNCVIGQNVFIGKNVRIGDNVKIQNNVSVYENVEIERDVFVDLVWYLQT